MFLTCLIKTNSSFLPSGVYCGERDRDMKKQQWLFKVFSKTLTPLLNSSISYNIARPFCLAATPTPTPTPTPTNTSLFDVNGNNKLHMLSKKKLPLLIVPSSTKERKLGYYSSVCNDTLGFISFFHADGDGDHDDHDQLNKKEEEVYKVYLPEIANRRICGSSEGWLITVHENSEIQLLNPISRVLVHLPPLTSFPEVVGKFVSEEIVGEELVPEDSRGLCYLVNSSLKNNLGTEDRPRQSYQIYGSHHFQDYFLVKVVTNTTTDANSTVPTVVMAICGLGKLAFCRPSSTSNKNGIDKPKRWIRCLEDYGNERNNYQDVTFYKGNFYAVRPSGHVVVVKGIDGPSPLLEVIIQEPSPLQETEYKFHPHENYLVESSSSSSGGGGDLLKVMRDVVLRADEETETEEESDEEEHPYRTIGFRVLKLDFNGPSWEEVTDLGEDTALFVGYNRSFSFSASKLSGCRGNCIYFTDNIHEFFYTNPNGNGGHDMGVYDLKDGSIEKFYKCSSQLFMPPPVWYMPNSKS